MALSSILVLMGLAVVFSGLLAYGFGWRHPSRGEAGTAMLFLFILFFFSMWLAMLWSPVVGPMPHEAFGGGVLFAGLLLALLFLAIAPPRRRRSRTEEKEEAAAVAAAFGIGFWALLVVLVGYIVWRLFL